MQIKEILNCFEDPKGRFPSKALSAALKQQEIITPYLLSILENTISNYDQMNDDRMDHLFSLYLLSKFREKKAFPYILALASLPEEWPEELLGDCITESLTSFIVSTFNSDISSIKKLIEDQKANIWSRAAALKSLLGLVALQLLNREELIEYIRSLFHSPLANDEEFVTRLVDISNDIYPEELMVEINDAFDKNKVDTFCIDRKWIEQTLSNGKEQCLSKYVYKAHFHLPIDDVEKEMGWMSGFHTPKSRGSLTPKTIINHVHSTPKLGRNDLCSCGSAKKFKKCCLMGK